MNPILSDIVNIVKWLEAQPDELTADYEGEITDILIYARRKLTWVKADVTADAES